MNTINCRRRQTSAMAAASVVLGLVSSSALASGSFAVLYNFTGASNDGDYPNDSLISSGANLYGMIAGGATGNGSIFQYNTSANSLSFIYSFKGGTSDGSNPVASLTQVGNILYGMTYNGGGAGEDDFGTIFGYNLGTQTETMLHAFTGSPDGKSPAGSFTQSGTNPIRHYLLRRQQRQWRRWVRHNFFV